MQMPSERGAIETAKAIAMGESSAVAECEAAIARIEDRDGEINAVVVRDFDRALEAARAADEANTAGEVQPLHGVPMTVKESHDVAGLPTTWGLEEFKNHIAERDSLVVRRLKKAGAIILGKTNVPPMLADWQSSNPVYGRTNNPHDHTRTPGGSSGGGAAALAAGMVPLEFGTDIGGSIRIPGSYCGVYGHKTSYGVIGLEGHYFPGMDGADIPLSVTGPLARSIDDIALALDITSDISLPRSRCRAMSDFRILVLTDNPVGVVNKEITEAIENAAAACERAGAKVSRSSELLPNLAVLHGEYIRMLLTVLAARDPNPAREPPRLPEWLEMVDAQARCRRQWRSFFEQFDAILAPVNGTTAFPHDGGMEGRILSLDGKDVDFGAQFGWIGIATYPGLPGISVPVGEDAQGLPIGLQIIGDYHADHTVIELARLIGKLG